MCIRDRPGAARLGSNMAGAGGALPLAFRQFLAARRGASGRGGPHRRGRARGLRIREGDRMRELATEGYVLLEDGTAFRGESVGADGTAFGEAVFATAMTGYQEILTDPSYAEQLICFTAPMVGNYGVARGRSESARPQARAASPSAALRG